MSSDDYRDSGIARPRMAPRYSTAAPLADMLLADEPWMKESICGSTDPEMFFPEKGGSTRQAKSVCLRCPVREPCLEYALDHDERFGIWGGKSERERRRIKRLRKPKKEAVMPPTKQENDYVQELVGLLTDTIAHPDPLVRSIRKMVAQGAVALKEAVASYEFSKDEGLAMTPPAPQPDIINHQLDDNPEDHEQYEPPKPAPAKRKPPVPSVAQQLMERYKLEPGDIREWAREQGKEVASRGTIPLSLVQDYLEANPQEAAS